MEAQSRSVCLDGGHSHCLEEPRPDGKNIRSRRLLFFYWSQFLEIHRKLNVTSPTP